MTESTHRSLGQASSSSSTTGSHILSAISNRFEDLEGNRRVEEIAIQAEQAMEERVRDTWDQESRSADIADRKQRWHADKHRKVDNHPVGRSRFMRNHTKGSGPEGIGRVSAEHSAYNLGSSTFSTRGPEAAGGLGPSEPPSASGGVDLEERGAPLGQL
eukprot:13907662-Heterocapsa_arctica.AAC.1